MKKLASFLLSIFALSSWAEEGDVANTIAKDAPIKEEAVDENSDLKGTDARQALTVLIKRKQYPQAFTLASRISEVHEGDTQFDFQYGLSAVETANYDQALFAFERLLFSHPSNSRYRLELARTHFFLQNLEQAEREFHRVLKQNPPDTVKQNVQIFLDKIAGIRNSVAPKFSAYAQASGGYDSNINSATNKDTLPANEVVFGQDILLSADSRETASTYMSLLANGSYTRPLTKHSGFDVRAEFASRYNTEVSTYDLNMLNGEGGYIYYYRDIKFRGAGKYQYVTLDGNKFVSTVSGMAQAYGQIRNKYTYATNLSWGLSEFHQLDDSDIQQLQLNGSIASGPAKQSWVAGAAIGLDTAESSVNDHLGKTYLSLTYQQTHLWKPKVSYYLLGSVTFSNYDSVNENLYTKVREDVNVVIGGGFRLTLTKNLTITNDYSIHRVDSTLEANTYNRFRMEAGLSFSY